MPEFRLKATGWILVAICLSCIAPVAAGVSKEIQSIYIQTYENRALYLKVPIQGGRQVVFVRPSGPVLDSSMMGQAAVFRVGDQVRVTDVEFRNTFVRFRLTSIDGSKLSELHFVFPDELTNLFPERPYFDAALNFALTQGESYRDIEAARETFVENQFDRLLAQFASTAGISRDQLVQRITDSSPDFQQAKSEVAKTQRELQTTRKALEDEKARADALARETSALQRKVREADGAADSLKEERFALLNERDELRNQLNKLQSDQAQNQRKMLQYEQQVDELIGKLDVQGGSANELGSKVQSLSGVIDSLKQEGSKLSEKLAESSRRANELLQQNEDLQEEVRKLQNQKARLDSNLRILTTGNNNVNKTLLEVRQERDNLVAARALQAALRWQNEHHLGELQEAVISLNEHPLARFKLEEPATVDRAYSFSLQLESPDLVKFNEEERAFYDQLGEQVQVQTSWKTPEGIQAQLLEGEHEQKVAPRGEARWRWSFTGGADQPRPVIMTLSMKDANGNSIQLAEREFVLRSAGFLVTLSNSFSLWSLLLGLAAGLSMILFLRRPKSARKAPPHPVEYMANKRL